MPTAESKKVVNTADLKARTKHFALRVMKLVDALPRTIQGRVDSGLLSERKIRPLLMEAGELVAIMAASRKSAIANRQSAIP